MAATIAVAKHAGKQPSAPNIQLYLDFTGDTSYPAGGYPFDAPALLQSLGGYDKPPADAMVIGEPKGLHILQYDRAAKKLQLFLLSTGLEVAGAVDVSVTPGLMRVKIESC